MTGANCVETPPGRGPPVLGLLRRALSGDDQISIKPGHHVGQRRVIQYGTPERRSVGATPPLRETTAQKEAKDVATRLQPVSPPPQGSTIKTPATATALVQRSTHQQEHQDRLLHRPVIPPARRNTQRQARAGAPTPRTTVAAHRHRVERRAVMPSPIRLALIVAMSPHHFQPAVRTTRRTIHLRRIDDRPAMMFKGLDARYNPLHRLGSSGSGVVSITSHVTRGVPAYPLP